MKTKVNYTDAQKTLFNLMLTLNYSEPYISISLLQEASGMTRHKLSTILGDLISLNLVLSGNEEVMGTMIHTYTPKVGRGGQSYGYPLDYFKWCEWLAFKI